MALGYSIALRNAMLNQITSLAGANALINIYDGTRPATGGAATTLLAQLLNPASFANSAVNAVLTLNPITQDSSANADGTATWFRITTSGGTQVVDGSVGIAGSGADMILSTTTIATGLPVGITSFTITEANP